MSNRPVFDVEVKSLREDDWRCFYTFDTATEAFGLKAYFEKTPSNSHRWRVVRVERRVISMEDEA